MTGAGPDERIKRPLPQPTISSEPFWISGADGRLRISRCSSCGRHHHPPQPICPDCRSADVARAYVTGEAIEALCGKKWVPTRDPSRYPVCPTCKERKAAGWTLK